jgi:hypothetical protein
MANADQIAELGELRAVLHDSSTRLTWLNSGLERHRRALQSLQQIKLGL